MVGARKLLKVLHLRRTNQITSASAHDQGSATTSRNLQTLEIDEDSAVCRVCLKPGNIPIYGNYDYNDVSLELSILAAIRVRVTDAYPKYLCKSCHSLLQGAIMLRKLAQYSDQVLRPDGQDLDPEDPTDLAVQEYLQDQDPTSYGAGVSSKPKYQYEKSEIDSIMDQKPYQCVTCNLYFKTEKEYIKHKDSEEHKNFKANCPICKKEYNAVYLKQHMRYHSKDVVEVCDICGKEFTIKHHYESHRRIHTRELPFKCSMCPYRGRFKYSLKVHMRLHTGERPYQCPHCPNRAFIHKGNLSRHLLTHKTEKAFTCDSCQKGFHFKTELEHHVKVVHIGIKDYVCNFCGKAFGDRSHLLQHQVKVHNRKRTRNGRMPLYLLPEYQESDAEKGNNPV